MLYCVFDTCKLALHYTQAAYTKFPRFFREVMNRLHPSEIMFYSVDGVSGYMTNLFPAKFVEKENREWKSSEHYYQAHKFAWSHEGLLFELVRSQPTAILCYKTAYQHQEMFDREWTHVKDRHMWEALKYKFGQNLDLTIRLKDSGNKKLIEHALKNAHYGCGKDHKDKNTLGRMLIALRDGREWALRIVR